MLLVVLWIQGCSKWFCKTRLAVVSWISGCSCFAAAANFDRGGCLPIHRCTTALQELAVTETAVDLAALPAQREVEAHFQFPAETRARRADGGVKVISLMGGSASARCKVFFSVVVTRRCRSDVCHSLVG